MTDQEYFELLARCVFSAGLGSHVVEARWEGLREAFFGFDPQRVAEMGEGDVARLLGDHGVIRNRRKIEAVMEDARRFLTVTAESGSFAAFLKASGDEGDMERVQEALSARFVHLGASSAGLFLFSAGWRERRAAA